MSRSHLALLLALVACRRQEPEPSVTVYDEQGLPDCAASYKGYDVCAAVKPWRSTVPDGYAEPTWLNTPVRWIGTEVQPTYCSDDAAEAEAWVLAQAPETDGTHAVHAGDPRWFDIIRYDADGVAQERQRVVRCAFLAELGPTPPGTDPVEAYARYATVPVADEDFFPVMREITKWRQTPLQFQAILSWGEVRTEMAHLRICGVRCGVCDDPTGGRFQTVTGVLERIDWTLDPESGVVSFEVEPLLEVECYANY